MSQYNSYKRNFSNNGFSRMEKPEYRSSSYRSRPQKKGRGERIDIGKFVNRRQPQEVVSAPEIENSFKDFGFSAVLEQNLASLGFNKPTLIQDRSISHIMKGSDLVGLANTGTGKTAAFLLPLIHKCYLDRNQKVLIIAPTRELAQQTEGELRKFARGMGLYSVVCVGGVPSYNQISSLRRKPNFVIGTPGRLKDLRDRGAIYFRDYQNIILDEIDRMLDMGFIEEIKKIMTELPENRQSLFFSATLPEKIKVLVRQFLANPVMIQATTGETATNIDQDVVRVGRENKFDKLKDILIEKDLTKVLIFSETKRDVERLTLELIRDGFKADSIHGDKRQSQRQRALLQFKEDRIQILVATDVAARGLDIDNVSHVINYTVPQTYEDYIHRIGRTGRGTKSGKALTFVDQR